MASAPDDCDDDCDNDGTPDDQEPDCDNDGIPDDCEPIQTAMASRMIVMTTAIMTVPGRPGTGLR
jgi:hypothetical protein